MGLDTKFLVFPTCPLNKVREAYIDGEYIAGVGSEPWASGRPEVVCEQFLNCRTDDDILRFTRRYGPISDDLRKAPKLQRGESFRFEIASWRELQYDLESCWGNEFAGFGDDVRSGDHFRMGPDGQVHFEFSDASRLIKFLMSITPRDKKRRCENPDCHKYFFAEKRSQVYCGAKACKHFGSLKNKRECWERNRSMYLASRREK